MPRFAAMPASRRLGGGFTLVELVMVLVVLGALSVFVLPRLVDVASFRLRAYADELASQMMAMQRLALVQRRPIVATINSDGVRFAYASGTAIADLPCPAGSTPCIDETGPRSATFNAGNGGATTTSTGGALPVTIHGADFTLAYRIESETGLFRALP